MNSLNEDCLNCLNCWPENTIGYQKEKELISELNKLCMKFGYGRVSQLTKYIEQIWRDDSKISNFEIQRKQRLLLLKEVLEV